MPIASAFATRCGVVAHHLREDALDGEHLHPFVLKKLANDVGLLCAGGEETRIDEPISTLIKHNGELLMEPNADLVSKGLDINRLIFCTCRRAEHEWREQNC